MKLWKCAAIALTLCGAALSVFLSRILLPPTATFPLRFELSSFSSSSSSSSSLLSSPASPATSMSSNSSSPRTGRRFRRVRSANGASSVVSEFMHMFQSFTEGELKQIVDALVERKGQRDSKQSKRTKRNKNDKNDSKDCSLREKEVTIRQLGMGYESDETFVFRYCSGSCEYSRRNYDLWLRSLKRNKMLRGEDLKHARPKPCCRPTAYDKDISFLDDTSKYHTIREVSARRCSCV